MTKMENSFQCINCKSDYETAEMIYECPRCHDLLEIRYDYERMASEVDTRLWRSRPFSVWRYLEQIPISGEAKIVTLGEGGTGLHKSENLAKDLRLNKLRIKFEGENPTGSFKDRGMTVSVSKALEVGARIVACASTGNTSASLSAYAARAGLRCVVLIPAGKIGQGKLAQAIAHGATILEIEGNFDDALRSAIELTKRDKSIALMNSVNPFRIEGQKTLAFEVCDQLGFKSPDVVVVPVGNAGNISAIWKGFEELIKLRIIDKAPRMMGIQAEGAAPIASAYKQKNSEIQIVQKPETIATAIRIGAPASWKKALRAVRDSQGAMETVSDEEILQAQKDIARREGLFVEPASASSVAGLKKLLEQDLIDEDEEIVCVATGHGLKDTQIVTRIGELPIRTKCDIESIETALALRGPAERL
jgi:threonine synthase